MSKNGTDKLSTCAWSQIDSLFGRRQTAANDFIRIRMTDASLESIIYYTPNTQQLYNLCVF